MVVAKRKLAKCVKCSAAIKSHSPVRKYCFDCRIKMKSVWIGNFKKKIGGRKNEKRLG